MCKNHTFCVEIIHCVRKLDAAVCRKRRSFQVHFEQITLDRQITGDRYDECSHGKIFLEPAQT